MQKTDAIQARQRRADERTSVVLGATSLLTLGLVVSMIVTMFVADPSPDFISRVMSVVAALPGAVALYLRFRNRS
ncbi:hypothetical protein [Streptomyces nojiriensis]|uniref:hypothetical protein n=1 Tax=Streptomyces nojiriensis TaxID=66374 RepID=UPI0035D6A1F5